MPSGTLSDGLREIASSTLRENFTNLVPTTYEAAKAYLDQELLKPEGQRDLLREMYGAVHLDTATFVYPK